MKKWRFAFLTPALIALVSIAHYMVSGLSQPVLQLWIVLTARIGFLLFFLAFSASGLNRFFKSGFTKMILSNRSQVGVAFALTHFFHLGLIVHKDFNVEAVFAARAFTSIVPGILAYFFIGLMLLTSFDYFRVRLSPKTWSRIHTIGGYVILFVFTGAYFKRLENPAFWPLILLATSAWIIRLLNLLKPVVKTA